MAEDRDKGFDELLGAKTSSGMPRPNNPAMWQLAELVLGLDAEMAEGGEIEAAMGELTDGEALTYVAMQRAFRGLGIRTRRDLAQNRQQVIVVASMYIEGFVLGARHQRKYGRTG